MFDFIKLPRVGQWGRDYLIEIAPWRRISMSWPVTRATVEGTPPGLIPPSTTMSAERPTSASAEGASEAGRLPDRFALVTRSTPPHRAISFRVQSWSGTRSPSPAATIVSAPGQWRSSAFADGGNPPTNDSADSASLARSAIGLASGRDFMV